MTMRALSLVLAASLAGCAEKTMLDLETYTAEVLARKGRGVELLPEMKPPERYLYRAQEEGKPDPFVAFFDLEKQGQQQATVKVDPEQERMRRECAARPPEELESFELDSLRMVGTLEDTEVLWGIIVDRGGTVHRVKVGNYIGRNCGKILEISEARIDIREIVTDAENKYLERQASIALAEQ